MDHRLPEGPAGLATVRSLAQWALDYAIDGDHLGFPFDRPYLSLYERCRMVRRAAAIPQPRLRNRCLRQILIEVPGGGARMLTT